MDQSTLIAINDLVSHKYNDDVVPYINSLTDFAVRIVPPGVNPGTTLEKQLTLVVDGVGGPLDQIIVDILIRGIEGALYEDVSISKLIDVEWLEQSV